MKKLSTLSLLLMSFLALCQGIKFEEGNFAGILAKAKKENKLVFLDGYTSWCGPCKYMAKNIFTVQSVGDYYNANFINAKIDMEKGEGKTIAKKYNIVSYPNLLFLNGDGQVVHRINMSLSEEDFLQLGKDAKDPSKQLVLIKKKLEKGENNLDFLKTATTAFIKAQEMNLAEKSLDQYFKQKQKQTNDLTEDETNMLISVLRYNPSGTAYTFLKNRKEDIIKVIPLDLYENYVYSFKLNSISNKAYNKKTNTLNEALFLAEAEKAFGKEKAHKILLRKKANLALNKKDYSTFEKINLDIYKDPSQANSSELNEVAWIFFENIDNKQSLEKAILWAQESVKKDQGYENTDTLANLYNKTGDKKNAKIWAEKSIELAKSTGKDFSSTQKLLDTLK